MRRILLSCATLAVLALAAAGSAGARGQATSFGLLVVQNGVGDGGIYGHPVVTLVVEGFVLGRISPQDQARVDIYQSPSAGGQGGFGAVGDVSSRPVRWRGFAGKEFSGSGFRFHATGGAYRVVIRGSGVYVFAGGRGGVKLRGSAVYPKADGRYALDGAAWRSLPDEPVTRMIGGG
ncbi:MAG TPA: hypothetical protein VKO84_09185 [Gaiellaceae bacterium]|nr:hypothetical protein [Gaiellaceae bacterium]